MSFKTHTAQAKQILVANFDKLVCVAVGVAGTAVVMNHRSNQTSRNNDRELMQAINEYGFDLIHFTGGSDTYKVTKYDPSTES